MKTIATWIMLISSVQTHERLNHKPFYPFETKIACEADATLMRDEKWNTQCVPGDEKGPR